MVEPLFGFWIVVEVVGIIVIGGCDAAKAITDRSKQTPASIIEIVNVFFLVILTP